MSKDTFRPIKKMMKSSRGIKETAGRTIKAQKIQTKVDKKTRTPGMMQD